MNRTRVAEIWASDVSADAVGSAYLIGDRLLLTAYHVVSWDGKPAAEIQVRCLDQEAWSGARLAWSSLDEDLALIEVAEEGWQPPQVQAPRWGRIEGVEEVGCTMVGFPDVQVRPGGVRDVQQLTGTIRSLTRTKSGQFAIDLEGARARDRGPEISPWAGMSGAAVFVGPRLIAVVAGDPSQFQHDQLIATPLSRVRKDPELTGVLDSGGVNFRLESLIDELLPAFRQLPNEYSPSDLLRPEYHVVCRQGRKSELDDGVAWCLDPKAPLLDLIHGAGGIGKTRFALELCREMDRRDWICGFLADHMGPEALVQILRINHPALVVVDYAETRAELGQQLRRLAAEVDSGTPMRLLLLAREASDWWGQLRRASADVHGLLTGVIPHTLDPVIAPEDREQAFREAVAAFAKVQRMPEPSLPTPTLTDPQFDSILLIHMAALDAVGTPQEPEPGAAAKGSLRVLETMLGREQRYWDRRPPEGMDATSVPRMVTVATLIGADNEGDAAALLKRVPDLREAGEERRRKLARWLQATYPIETESEYLGQLQPDALAEQLVSDVLLRTPELADSGFRGLSPSRAVRALTVLDRAARRRPDLVPVLRTVLGSDAANLAPCALRVALQTGDPIGLALAEILKETPLEPDLVVQLQSQVPWHTLALRETAAVLASQARQAAMEAGDTAETAGWSADLSARLSDLGRYKEALVAAQEAVDAYRQLATDLPDLFVSKLAGSVINMGTTLAELGRREEALATTREAVDIYRRLAKDFPDAFLPELATSLNNLGNRLTDVGRVEEALLPAQEAVEIRRNLAAPGTKDGLAELALAVSNLGNRLSDLGKHQEALEAAQEAADIRHRLAAARPDAFLPQLAGSLQNLSNRLSTAGRGEEALAAAQEAAEIRRHLAGPRPYAFLPDLAASLDNVGNRLFNLGRYGEALAAHQEAVEAYRRLAHERPERFQLYLARSLHNLSSSMAATGAKAPALRMIDEAIEILQRLVEQYPGLSRDNLEKSIALRRRLLDLGS